MAEYPCGSLGSSAAWQPAPVPWRITGYTARGRVQWSTYAAWEQQAAAATGNVQGQLAAESQLGDNPDMSRCWGCRCVWLGRPHTCKVCTAATARAAAVSQAQPVAEVVLSGQSEGITPAQHTPLSPNWLERLGDDRNLRSSMRGGAVAHHTAPLATRPPSG